MKIKYDQIEKSLWTGLNPTKIRTAGIIGSSIRVAGSIGELKMKCGEHGELKSSCGEYWGAEWELRGVLATVGSYPDQNLDATFYKNL